MTSENIEPSAKLRFAKARRSTIGSVAESTRAKKSSPAATASAAKPVTTSLSNQSRSGPSSSTYWSEPRNTAMEARPHQSKSRNSAQFGRS